MVSPSSCELLVPKQIYTRHFMNTNSLLICIRYARFSKTSNIGKTPGRNCISRTYCNQASVPPPLPHSYPLTILTTSPHYTYPHHHQPMSSSRRAYIPKDKRAVKIVSIWEYVIDNVIIISGAASVYYFICAVKMN